MAQLALPSSELGTAQPQLVGLFVDTENVSNFLTHQHRKYPTPFRYIFYDYLYFSFKILKHLYIDILYLLCSRHYVLYPINNQGVICSILDICSMVFCTQHNTGNKGRYQAQNFENFEREKSCVGRIFSWHFGRNKPLNL